MKENLINITEDTIIKQINDLRKNPEEIIDKLDGLDEAEISLKLLENQDLMVLWYITPNVVTRKNESGAILLALYNLFHAIQFFNNNQKPLSRIYSAVYLKLNEYSEKNNFKIFPVITKQFIRFHKK